MLAPITIMRDNLTNTPVLLLCHYDKHINTIRLQHSLTTPPHTFPLTGSALPAAHLWVRRTASYTRIPMGQSIENYGEDTG